MGQGDECSEVVQRTQPGDCTQHSGEKPTHMFIRGSHRDHGLLGECGVMRSPCEKDAVGSDSCRVRTRSLSNSAVCLEAPDTLLSRPELFSHTEE